MVEKLLVLFSQIIVPQLEPLTDQQIVSFNKLRLSSQQAEDALSQGLDKLQQSLVLYVAADPLDVGNFGFHMTAAMEKVEALEGFVNQVNKTSNGAACNFSLPIIPKISELVSFVKPLISLCGV